MKPSGYCLHGEDESSSKFYGFHHKTCHIPRVVTIVRPLRTSGVSIPIPKGISISRPKHVQLVIRNMAGDFGKAQQSFGTAKAQLVKKFTGRHVDVHAGPTTTRHWVWFLKPQRCGSQTQNVVQKPLKGSLQNEFTTGWARSAHWLVSGDFV